MLIEKLYSDYRIPFVTEGHKHCKEGWVNTSCPFCTGNPGWHLGYWKENEIFHCWRCGSHKTIETIAALLKVSIGEARYIARKYRGRSRSAHSSASHKQKPGRRAKNVKLPPGTVPLKESAAARAYLKKRRFSWRELERTWGICCTGPVGRYRFRIVAPITRDGKLVSYQCRDFTGKQTPPYKACRKEEEAVDHKHCLYGADLAGREVVVVEGITDVWRLGAGAVGTFGIEYTAQQVGLLVEYEKVFIMFDDDPQAIAQARKLARELCAFTDVEIISIEGDPASLSQNEAKAIMKELLL